MMAVYQSKTSFASNLPPSFTSCVHSSAPLCFSGSVYVFSSLAVVVCVSTQLWCFCFRVPLREDSPSDFTPSPWAHRSVSPTSGLYKQHVVSLLLATLHRHLITLWFACLCLSRSVVELLTVTRKLLSLALKSSSTDLVSSMFSSTSICHRQFVLLGVHQTGLTLFWGHWDETLSSVLT